MLSMPVRSGGVAGARSSIRLLSLVMLPCRTLSLGSVSSFSLAQLLKALRPSSVAFQSFASSRFMQPRNAPVPTWYTLWRSTCASAVKPARHILGISYTGFTSDPILSSLSTGPKSCFWLVI